MSAMSYEKLSMYNQAFLAYVQENNTIVDQCGNVIGRTEAAYQELFKTAEEFRAKLYEAGILKRPKTPEEMYLEQQEINRLILEKLQQLEGRNGEYKHSEIDSGTVPAVGQSEQVGGRGTKNQRDNSDGSKSTGGSSQCGSDCAGHSKSQGVA